MPEILRCCNACQRVISGPAGDNCPYCGSGRLAHIAVQQGGEIRRHTSVLTSAITFCLGLTLLRIVAAFAGPRSAAFAATGELVARLHMLSVACTALYLILRHYEGDFRALFAVSLGLFALAEGVAAIAGRFGVLQLESIGNLFNIALFMYSSLAVTAAIADGPRTERYQRPLAAACLGFVLLSCMRVFVQMRGGSERNMNFASALILLLIAFVAGMLLLRAENGASRAAAADTAIMPVVDSGGGLSSTPASEPPPPPPASSPESRNASSTDQA